MIDFDTVKELFKQSIDESDNMNDAIQRLCEKIYHKGQEESVSRWIPVSGRLPEPGREYLMTVRDFGWAGEPVTYSVVKRFYGGRVDFVAWMPLPEPYKEE